MPEAAIPIISLIIGGVGAGTSLFSALHRPSLPNIPATPPAASTALSTDQARSAIAPQALTIESLTGGSVSPDYLATIAPVLAGVAGGTNTPGALQQVLKDILGTQNPTPASSTATPGGGATAPFTPSGLPVNLQALASVPGLSDFLSKLGTAVT